MNNENNRLTYPPYQSHSSQNLHYKLASLLAMIVTFQEKIEILRSKLCGHPNFSPELYYKQIDRSEKGYIDSEDIVTFIKKSKPTFNIDHRYLKSLFAKLNQDPKIPRDRLTYFGYLNIIKPYFDTQLARDLLFRDSITMGSEINSITKKLLEELICTLYVCVAEHEQVKELIIFGDVQQGGSTPGTLFNIHQILEIIRENGQPLQPTQRQIPNTGTQLSINPIPSHNHILQNPQPQPTNTRTNPINQSRPSILLSSNRSNLSHSNKPGILDTFYYYIVRNSQYEIERSDMKYMLAYMMCHEFMVIQEKYLTQLFMPVSANTEGGAINNPHTLSQQKSSLINIPPSSDINFLTYIHPNSISNQHLQQYRKKQKPFVITRPHKRASQNPELLTNKSKINHEQFSSHKLIDDQPRILIHGSQHNLQTPILQRFMRQSKVLKNMSRYKPDTIQQQSSNSSAFIAQSQYKPKTPQNFLNPTNNIATQHTQKPINKDFNLQEVLNNSNLHKSEYYQNLSVRAFMKNQPLKPAEFTSQKYQASLQSSGILNNFMLK